MMEFLRDGLLALFEIFVNLSLVGGFCVLLVLVARFLLRKAPKWCSYILWSVVFLRLICPVFPEGSFSLIPRQLSGQLQIDGESILEQVQEAEQTNIEGGILATADTVVNEDTLGKTTGTDFPEQGMLPAGMTGNVIDDDAEVSGSEIPHANEVFVNSETLNRKTDSDLAGVSSAFASTEAAMQRNQTVQSIFDIGAMTSLMIILAVIWLIGVVGFAVYHIASYQLLKRRVKNAVPCEDGVLELQGEHLSFVMGIVNPKIYLSEGLDVETRRVILCHESVHLKRRDYIFKPAALGICCLHWWNPLVWLAFYLMNKDCEMSCDERVVALLGEESKTVYSYALLSEATCGESFHGRRGSVCALLSFGEDHVKNRISHVLKYKKASIGVVCCAVLVLAVLAVGICSNPKSEETSEALAEVASKEQEEALKAQEEALEAQKEELLKELEMVKKEEALVAEQEALQEALEQVEKEQQEIARLEQELVQNTEEFSHADEFGEIALALERYARAFAERDGDALFELAGDKVAFQLWDMVYPQEDGSYAFGDSSPWVRDWTTLIREEDTSTATIRFIMENSVPEYYIAEETVRLTKAEDGYFVDHVDYKLYSEINSVAELEAVYDWTNGDAVKSIYYPAEYVRAILNHLVNKTNPEYYSAYQDPYTAAKTVLHLGEDKEELAQVQYVKTVSPQDASLSKYGEGTVCNVEYYFEDDSKAVIPMVLVEESMGIWMPATEDYAVEGLDEESSQKQYNAREIYDSCEVGDVTYQLTNMGIYQLDSKGLKLLYPTKVGVGAKLAYDNGNLYFPTDKSYYEGALDWADNSICVLNTKTLEVGYIDLPQSAWSVFPLGSLYVKDGYIYLWGDNGQRSYVLTMTDVFPVYNGKLATELNEEEKDAYGSEIREQILTNPNQVFRIGHHASTTTFAYVDMDGDGKSEKITISKHGDGSYLPMDSFLLKAGEGSQTCYSENQVNEIYAYSPDGERIFMMLYQDGPSGDPMSTFYRYEDDRLYESGTIASDVRNAVIENGIISTIIRRDVIQTDGIRVQYRINDKGEVELIEQETYDFTGLNDVELKEMLKLYAKPDGSLDMRIMMEPQTVHITKTDKNFSWVKVEAEDGTEGWIRVKDILYVGDDEVLSGVIFDGLSFAG